jgi:hypothetical protein
MVSEPVHRVGCQGKNYEQVNGKVTRKTKEKPGIQFLNDCLINWYKATTIIRVAKIIVQIEFFVSKWRSSQRPASMPTITWATICMPRPIMFLPALPLSGFCELGLLFCFDWFFSSIFAHFAVSGKVGPCFYYKFPGYYISMHTACGFQCQHLLYYYITHYST